MTPKQEKFCLVYIETGNASEAYRQAYNVSKMKPESVNNKAYELLKKVEIAARVDELRSELRQRHAVTVDRVIEEYAKIAFFDPRRLFHADGSIRPVSDWGDDVAGAVGGLEVMEIGNDDDMIGMLKKLKLIDKKGALDSLARHLGMFVDKQEVSVVQTPKIIVELSK